MMNRKKISLVIPMYYEEEVAEQCYKRVKTVLTGMENYDGEIVFVNDGSQDRTQEILEEIAAEDKSVKVISFARNFGHQCAVSAGLKYVTGDVVCIIDADLQDPPELIPEMVKKWEEGYEVIYGKRKTRKGESFFKLFTAKTFYKVLNYFSDVDIPKDTGDFRVVDKKVVDTINSMPEHNRFLRGMFSWAGYKQYAFEYERQERFAGQTKYPLKKMLKLASDGIVGFSKKPLELIGLLGGICLLLSLGLLVYAIVAFACRITSFGGETALILFGLSFFTGISLFSLRIVGGYVGRIYDESKGRPQYIVAKTVNVGEKTTEQKSDK